MTMSSRSPERGFTLVEILVAVGVTIGVVAAAYACLDSGFESAEVVDSRAQVLQNGRAALDRLAADLRSACQLNERTPFIGMDRKVGDIEADNLDFATHNWSPEALGESDFCEISYFVDRNGSTDEIGLWRRRDPSPDDKAFAGGYREEIATGVRGFRLEYYDGYEWLDRWGEDPDAPAGSSTAASQSTFFRPLPDAVRITIALDEPGSELPAGVSAFHTRDAEEDLEELEAMLSDEPELETPQDEGPQQKERGKPPLVLQTVVFLNLAQRVADSELGDGPTDALTITPGGG